MPGALRIVMGVPTHGVCVGKVLYLIAALVAAPLMLFGPDDAIVHPAFAEVWNLGHIVAFYFLTWIMIEVVKTRFGAGTGVLIVIGSCAIGLGFAIEVVQPSFGRSFSWRDLAFDCAGISIAMVRLLCAQRSALMVSLIALIGTICLLPLLQVLRVEWRLRQEFPQLFSANHDWAMHQIQADGATKRVLLNEERYGVETRFLPQQYSRFVVTHFLPDWRNHHTLSFEIVKADDRPMQIVCRIHDKHHSNSYSDRFNRTFQLKHGWNLFSVPLGEVQNAPRSRAMDMANITGLACFSHNLNETRTLYFHRIYLD